MTLDGSHADNLEARFMQVIGHNNFYIDVGSSPYGYDIYDDF